MKCVMLREQLSQALSAMNMAVSAKSTLPVLSNILFEARDDEKVRLSATNLEISLKMLIDAKVDDTGSTAIPADLFSKLASTLSDHPVSLVLDTLSETLLLKCNKTKSEIKCIDAYEFPTLPDWDEDLDRDSIRISAETLRAGYHHVAAAAANDDSRPVLQGIYLKVDSSNLMMAATDGFTLGETEIAGNVVNTSGAVYEWIIPARALATLTSLMRDPNSEVKIAQTQQGGNLVFKVGNTTMVSRIIHGTFPDYRRIVPSSYNIRAEVDKTLLSQAIKRVALFAQSSGNVVKLRFHQDLLGGHLYLGANAAEIGKNNDEIDINIEYGASSTPEGAEELEGFKTNGADIAINASYFIEALSAVGSDKIIIDYVRESVPLVFRPLNGNTNLYIVMPMALNR